MSLLDYKTFIGTSTGLSKSKSYLTQDVADNIYAKTNSNVFFNNSTVLGTSNTNDANVSDDLIVGDDLQVNDTATINNLVVSTDANIDGYLYTDGLTVNNVFSANTTSGLSFTYLPRLQSNIQPSNSNDLVSKSYVDAQDSLSTDLTSYRIALRTTLSVVASSQHVLTSPVLGQSITSAPTGVTIATVFVNLPPTTGTSEAINTFSFRFDYSYTVGKQISDALTRGMNAIERGIPFAADLQASSLSTSMVASSCIFQVSLYPNGIVGSTNSKIVCTGPIQSREIWINSTNMPKQWTHFYNSSAMTWLPINFFYSSQNRVSIIISAPNQANRANLTGWISNLSASVELLSCSSDTGQISKTNAYLSLS